LAGLSRSEVMLLRTEKVRAALARWGVEYEFEGTKEEVGVVVRVTRAPRILHPHRAVGGEGWEPLTRVVREIVWRSVEGRAGKRAHHDDDGGDADADDDDVLNQQQQQQQQHQKRDW